MTFGSVKDLIGNNLQIRLQALGMTGLGLYYDALPSSHERLLVRFWFPVYGGGRRAYEAEAIKKAVLQVDVKHFPPSGSALTPAPADCERVWEAVEFSALPGVGLTREPSGRPPARDPSDGALWGWHRYRLTL